MTAQAYLQLVTQAGQAAPLELYKLGSTIFLGIGIAAVLQGRLVPPKPDFPITDRARGLWATAEIVAAFAVLVCIVVGEVVALKVIRTGHAAGREQTTVIALLVATSAYVVVGAAIQRALAYVWKQSDGNREPILQHRLVANFALALTSGLLLGAATALLVLGRDEWPFVVLALLGLVGVVVGTRRLGQEVAQGIIPPGYKPSPVPLEDVIGTWTAARVGHGVSLWGGVVVLTKKYLVFSPLDVSATLSWLNLSEPAPPERNLPSGALSEPVAIAVGDLERVEVLNRARLLRPPTARLHLKGDRHLDIGIVAFPGTPNFRAVNNRAFDDWLEKLSVAVS